MTRASSKQDPKPGTSLSLKRLTGTALLLGCLSYGAMLFNASSWGAGSISILWPSTGFLIGTLLCIPRKHWPAYIAVGFAVDLLANLLIAPLPPLSLAVYQAGCSVIEVYLASSLLYSTFAPQRAMNRPGQLIRLLAYGAILAPAVASIIASCYFSGSFGAPDFHIFAQWFIGDALGNCIVIPLYLGLQKKAPFSERSWFEIVFLIVLLCASSIYVFRQTSQPLLFLIFPFLLLVEVRLGLAGSAIGLLAVTAVGGYFTARIHGSVALTHLASLDSHTLMLQFFTFVCMVVLYIMEVVLAESSQFELNLRASEQRFRLLAEGSHDIIMFLSFEKRLQYISPVVKTLLGWEPKEFLQLDLRSELFYPEEIPNLEKLFKECLAGKTFNTLDHRARKKDGGYLWLEANLVLHHDSETGAPAGFINVARDISRRKAAEEERDKALNVAESRANVDALTGVANRRSFGEYFESEWLRAVRARAATSILMIDVDYFKRYNDRYGHISGDHCLKQIARAIASCIHRTPDMVARYGGEEFAIVLPNTDASGAQSIGEQIRRAVEREQIPHEGNPPGVVTVSIGGATQIPKHGFLSTHLIESADKALYQAKSMGRNRVEQATEGKSQT